LFRCAIYAALLQFCCDVSLMALRYVLYRCHAASAAGDSLL